MFGHRLSLLVAVVPFLGLVLTAFPAPAASVYGASQDLPPSEQNIKKCAALSANCGLCTSAEECGYCISYLRSGDGTSNMDVRLCLAVNETTELPLTNEKCDNWRINTCPCPNDCSNHGTCDSDGMCECDYAWTGQDCSTPKANLVKPGVIIPIAIGTAFLGAALVVSIHLYGGGARCLERKDSSDKEGESEALNSKKKDSGPPGQPLDSFAASR